MCAPTLRYLCVVICVFTLCVATQDATGYQDATGHYDATAGRALDKKIELFEGVRVKIPQGNSTGRVMSLEVDTNRSVGQG